MIVSMGIDLATYTDELVKVADEHNESPMGSFDIRHAIGPYARAYANAYYGEDVKPERLGNLLPAKALTRLSLDQVCKIRHSTIFMMCNSVEDKFKNEPRFRIIEKIRSSMWRWGHQRASWNEMVDTYNAIRAFTFGHDDFQIRFDYTTSVNEIGASEYSRTFLDGALAYLVYYKGQHVMTLGFSVVAGYGVLIQQVQLKSRRGNRWMFKLPANRMEYVLGRFREAFPLHRLYVTDGADVANKNLNSYKSGVKFRQEKLAEYEARLPSIPEDNENHDYYKTRCAYLREEIEPLKAKIAHLEADVPRLKAFYATSGRFRQYPRKGMMKVNNQRHYLVA
jgi:hypothetical protein